jgi:hypothetical protein
VLSFVTCTSEAAGVGAARLSQGSLRAESSQLNRASPGVSEVVPIPQGPEPEWFTVLLPEPGQVASSNDYN